MLPIGLAAFRLLSKYNRSFSFKSRGYLTWVDCFSRLEKKVTHRYFGKVQGVYPYSELSKEQGMVHATASFVLNKGGSIANEMYRAVPDQYMISHARSGYEPRYDIHLFRLKLGDVPDLPILVEKRFHSELMISASSHPKGINRTEILASKPFQIQDGLIYLLAYDILRKEAPAHNEGWRLIFRVYGVKRSF